jgi:hypothetical protein
MPDKGGWKQVREAHAWYDDSEGDPPEKKGAYKLPHHELIDGRVDIPEKDKRVVWRPLARHHEQFDEEPPRPPCGLAGRPGGGPGVGLWTADHAPSRGRPPSR